MGAMLIHADRQTNVVKLIGAFYDYSYTPKNSLFYVWVNMVLFEQYSKHQYASVVW